MKKIFTELKPKTINIVLALIIIWTGFALDVYGTSIWTTKLHLAPVIATWLNVALVFATAVISLIVLLGNAIKEAGWTKNAISCVFGNENRKLFKIITTVFGFLIFMYVSSIFFGMFEMKVLKITVPGNPGERNVLQTFQVLPFLMFFEEAWTAVMLITVGNIVYRVQKNKNYNVAFIIATIVSAIAFACGHLGAYWNGNLLQTLIHVILVIGVTRVILNFSVWKTNSFLIALIAHYCFDTLTFYLGMIFKHS